MNFPKKACRLDSQVSGVNFADANISHTKHRLKFGQNIFFGTNFFCEGTPGLVKITGK